MKVFAFTLLLAVTASARDITISPGDSLEKARDMAHSGDRIVLHGGTYRLDEPLVLGPRNSGVTWMAYPNESPVISGGVPVTGWVPDADGRFKATVNLDNFRQLWVNGRRAERTRGPVPPGLKLWGKLEASVKKGINPPGLTGTPGYFPGTLVNIPPAGYTTTDRKLADWKNPGDIEFDYTGTWTHMICNVDKITGTPDGAMIQMAQPGFFLAYRKAGQRASEPCERMYMENAFELLHDPGQWYFDRPAHTLYYIPRPGEDMAKAQVIAPRLETLLEVKGTLDQPVRDVRFAGLTFAYATWLRPSTSLGHPDGQAGFIQHVYNGYFRPEDKSWAPVDGEGLKSPANVVVDAGRHIQFDGCTFTALGGAGLDLQDGAQSNIVRGCRFSDISGNGIQVGDVTRQDHHPSDPRRIVKDNQIVDNVITRIGVQYTDSVGVFYGYTEGTVVAHNDIFDIPYSAVSGGWGWGMTDAGGGAYVSPVIYQTPTPCKNNRIEFNDIHDLMRLRTDGGAVYTLGRQPGTIIRGNYIHNAGPGFPGGIYLDEGSADIEATGNLIYAVPTALNFNNHAQNRIATCRVHDNYLTPPVITTAGVNGQGYALKAGSTIDMPDKPRTDLPRFTITTWIRLNKYPDGSDPRRWIVCQASNEWADGNISFIVDHKSIGGYVNIGGGQQNNFRVSGTNQVLALNKWVPVALTYDGDTLRLYCDGREAGAAKIGKGRASLGSPWTIGGRSDRFSTFDCGDIAEVDLFNRALGPDELDGSRKSIPSGLFHAWNFENLAGQGEDQKIIAEAGIEPPFRKSN